MPGPPQKSKVPILKTFWRRFCNGWLNRQDLAVGPYRPQPSCKVWGGKMHLGDNIFVFITCLNTNFQETTKFTGQQKYLGSVPPNVPRAFRPGRVEIIIFQGK